MQASSEQVARYSAAQEKRLLKDFDRTCALMEETVRGKYGAAKAEQMRAAVREEYNLLIPEIPRISGARMLNTFLVITAQELAAYKGLKRFDMQVEEIWQLCHKAIRLRTNAVPKWKRWLLKHAMFSKPVKRLMSQRATPGKTVRFGDFEIEYLAPDQDFDVGVNYRGCGNYSLAMKHGGAEFAPYVCMSDIALSEAFGWGLVRTQTLADGCDHCDFRMTKGGPTRI